MMLAYAALPLPQSTTKKPHHQSTAMAADKLTKTVNNLTAQVATSRGHNVYETVTTYFFKKQQPPTVANRVGVHFKAATITATVAVNVTTFSIRFSLHFPCFPFMFVVLC